MDAARAAALLDRLHEAQNAFYGGGGDAALHDLLTADIAWTVPGTSPIAGSYRGLPEVLDYFRRRREIARSTFRMHRRDVLVGEGNRIAALTDGTAVIGDTPRAWSTVGLYDVEDGRISACWLLPLDPVAFDAIWTP